MLSGLSILGYQEITLQYRMCSSKALILATLLPHEALSLCLKHRQIMILSLDLML